MPNRAMAAAVALVLATTAAPAAELTVEQVKAKYAAIFEAHPQQFQGRTFYVMKVNDLPAEDVLAGFVNGNQELLDYLLLHGSECGQPGKGRKVPGGSLEACVKRLARDQSFNDVVLPLLARYLGTIGIDLAGYPVVAKRDEIDLDHVMNVAARFFYPDVIKEDGAIQAHVCIGINGLSDLTGPRNLVLEAFVHGAINGEMRKDTSRMGRDFEDELEAISDLDLSSDPKVRLTRAQGAMWAHMARSRHLRRVLLAEYDRVGSSLPFVIVEEAEP